MATYKALIRKASGAADSTAIISGITSDGSDVVDDGASPGDYDAMYVTWEGDWEAETVPASATAPDAFVDADWSVATGASTGGQLDVTIASLPANNGETITDVEYDLDASGSWVSSGGTVSFTITDLTAATSYDVRLRAVNSVGNGPAGNTETATSSEAASGGASGNFTFSIVQTDQSTFSTTPRSLTPEVFTQGSVLVAIVGDRSGGDPADHTVTDASGKTWFLATSIDNSVLGEEAGSRATMSVWWRPVDVGEQGPIITATTSAGTSTRLAFAEIAPSAPYDWTLANQDINGSGVGVWDNTSSGPISATGDDLCVMGFALSRSGSDALSTLAFDEHDVTEVDLAGTNGMAWAIGVTSTSQPDSGSYTSTVDTAGDGTDAEGMVATLIFKDGA